MISTDYFGAEYDSVGMLSDKSIGMSSHDQNLAIIHLAINRVESERETSERVHCGNYPDADFAASDGGIGCGYRSCCCLDWSRGRSGFGSSTGVTLCCCDDVDVDYIHWNMAASLEEAWNPCQGWRIVGSGV